MQLNAIEKIVFDIDFNNPEKAHEFSVQFQDYVTKLFHNELDKALNQMNKEGNFIYIEKLEIDLGTFSYSTWKSKMGNELIKAISDLITKKIRIYLTKSISLSNIGFQKKEDHFVDCFLFFLKNGYLPWYFVKIKQNALKAILISNSQLRTYLFNELEINPSYFERFIHSTSLKNLYSIVKVSKNLNEYQLNKIKYIVKKLSKKNKQLVRSFLGFVINQVEFGMTLQLDNFHYSIAKNTTEFLLLSDIIQSESKNRNRKMIKLKSNSSIPIHNEYQVVTDNISEIEVSFIIMLKKLQRYLEDGDFFDFINSTKPLGLPFYWKSILKNNSSKQMLLGIVCGLETEKEIQRLSRAMNIYAISFCINELLHIPPLVIQDIFKIVPVFIERLQQLAKDRVVKHLKYILSAAMIQKTIRESDTIETLSIIFLRISKFFQVEIKTLTDELWIASTAIHDNLIYHNSLSNSIIYSPKLKSEIEYIGNISENSVLDINEHKKNEIKFETTEEHRSADTVIQLKYFDLETNMTRFENLLQNWKFYDIKILELLYKKSISAKKYIIVRYIIKNSLLNEINEVKVLIDYFSSTDVQKNPLNVFEFVKDVTFFNLNTILVNNFPAHFSHLLFLQLYAENNIEYQSLFLTHLIINKPEYFFYTYESLERNQRNQLLSIISAWEYKTQNIVIENSFQFIPNLESYKMLLFLLNLHIQNNNIVNEAGTEILRIFVEHIQKETAIIPILTKCLISYPNIFKLEPIQIIISEIEKNDSILTHILSNPLRSIDSTDSLNPKLVKEAILNLSRDKNKFQIWLESLDQKEYTYLINLMIYRSDQYLKTTQYLFKTIDVICRQSLGSLKTAQLKSKVLRLYIEEESVNKLLEVNIRLWNIVKNIIINDLTSYSYKLFSEYLNSNIIENLQINEITLFSTEEWKEIKQEKQKIVLKENGNRIPNQLFDGIYIQNSGMIILIPYLKILFSRLFLLDEKGCFKDENHINKGVFILQYLACKNITIPEYNLVLNKILCGVDASFILREIEPLTQKEMQEVENLLNVVIGHWKLLKNMSADSLRVMFLMREGKLLSHQNGWQLSVVRKDFDILVDNIPWTIKMSKSPWMKSLIYTEW